MDDFKVIYRILKCIYASMDFDDFNRECLSPEALHVSQNKIDALLVMLAKDSLIDNVVVRQDYGGAEAVKFVGKPALTLKGLEYLEDNSMMKKAKEAFTGIANIIL